MKGLQYVKYNNVDKAKWEHLISSSDNALIFCNYDYLNAFCKWDAIILDNYQGAIALPRKNKLFFSQLYQPNFIQKTCWFGKPLSEKELTQIWELINIHFSHIHFNTNLPLSSSSNKRINLILPILSLKENHQQFSKSLRKNITKATDLIAIEDISQIDETISLYKSAYGKLNNHLKPPDYLILTRLSSTSKELFTNVIVTKNNEIVAGLLFAKMNNRLHYILGAPSYKGRKVNALSYGLNHIIKTYQNQHYILDFEGSMIPSVKDYYESFGSHDEPFYEIRGMAKWLKKPFMLYKRLRKS